MLYDVNMDKDGNFFNVNPIKSVGQNPFTASNKMIEEPKSYSRRLNGYDSSILNEKAIPQTNEKLNLDYQISEKQKALTDIGGKIKIAELYGTQNEVLSLKSRKQRLERELFELKRQKSDTAVKTLSGEIINIPWIKRAQVFLSRNVLAKVSKKFNSLVFLGDSLEKLSEINKSVDALIEMNVPYGEKKENYEKITQYLNTANQIHSQISKTMSGLK